MNQKYIIRAHSGVFYAEIVDRSGEDATLKNARRIWSWTKATECIGIAMSGIGEDSKVTVTIPQMEVIGVLEVIPCSETATKILDAYPEWKL